MGSPPTEWSRGANNEEETVTTLTHSFVIQETELTRAQWASVNLPPPGAVQDYGADCMEEDCPVGDVSWYRALAFANALSEVDDYEPCYELVDCSGSLPANDLQCAAAGTTLPTVYECAGYRLPTAAEWEYAARAGTRTALYSGDMTPQAGLASCGPDPNIEAIAWYCGTSGGNVTHPVRQRVANQWGLFDVAGNTLEWLSNSPSSLPGPDPWTDPFAELEQLGSQVMRGGNAWAANANMRLASGHVGPPNQSGAGVGLRLVRTIFN